MKLESLADRKETKGPCCREIGVKGGYGVEVILGRTLKSQQKSLDSIFGCQAAVVSFFTDITFQ